MKSTQRRENCPGRGDDADKSDWRRNVRDQHHPHRWPRHRVERGKPPPTRPVGRVRWRRSGNDDELLAEAEKTFDLLYEAYFEAPR